MTESAVRYFTPESTMFHRKVRAKLSERRIEMGAFLVGGAASDYADYRYRCGQIDALKEAMDICDAAEKEER